jgi:small subunit ribosomal protein S21
VLKLLSENRESSDNQGGLLITQVIVYQNQVERALKVLKRQLNKDGLFKDLKQRRFYMKPSVKKKLKIKEAKKKRKAANRRSSSSWQL